MKATAPLRPHRDSCSLRLEEQEEEDLLCLHHDMNDYYSRLRRLVPTIPPHKKVSRVELLQHVIDYIVDLQLALESQPALCRPAARAPLAVINTQQRTTVVNKQEDSILCR
ncbi:DNA-binding protein inhibitor ID-4 [Hoplias malabaricus]|uniref:DNA-binding protein inhibitor ID-4 n=1 Tax=Hoplias malabaricus TaxID=27720 RepID=UPI0034618B77